MTDGAVRGERQYVGRTVTFPKEIRMHIARPAGRGPASLALILALAIGTAACGGSARPTLSARGTSTDLSSETGRGVTVSGDEASVKTTVLSAPPEQVWPALLKALPAAGVPVETADKATWTAGSPAYGVKGRLGGKRLSTFLRCGGTAGVAEVADAHHVTMGVLASLRPAAAGTELQVRLVGSAKDPFTSVAPRQCVSTGALEAQVDSAVRALLP